MGWKQWAVVGVVIGAGIVLQIPGHEEVHDGMGHAGMEHDAAPARPSEPAGPYRTVVLDVTGMTCEGCATTARVAVERVEGVREASFSYPRGEGVVTFDTTITSPESLIAELERMTGFRATIREEPQRRAEGSEQND